MNNDENMKDELQNKEAKPQSINDNKPVVEQIELDKLESIEDLKKSLQNTLQKNQISVYINSLGKYVNFKEISVQQQKMLSRVMIGNETRKDIIYDTQCNLINEAAAVDGFSIYDYTELERLKLMMALYSTNMSTNTSKFTCSQCGCENTYNLDFARALEKLDALDINPKHFMYESKNLKYDFTLMYPYVKRISKFYKSYCAKYKNKSKRDVKVNDAMSNMEYINLFISSIKLSDKNDQVLKNIPLYAYKPEDAEELLQILPQDVLYTENGVLQFVTTEFLEKMNNAFDKQVCSQCGAVQENNVVESTEGLI